MGAQEFDTSDPTAPGFYFWRENSGVPDSDRVPIEVDYRPGFPETVENLILIDTVEQISVADLRALHPSSEWVGPLVGNGVNPDMEVFQVADIAARDAIADPKEGWVAHVADSGNGFPRSYSYDEDEPGWVEFATAEGEHTEQRTYFFNGDTTPPPAPAGAPAQYYLIQTKTNGDILRWYEDGT